MPTAERVATWDAAATGVAAADVAGEPLGAPRLAIATVCLSGTLEDKLAAAAAARFHGVEIFDHDLVASPWSPRRVRQECDRRGLAIDLYQPLRDFEAVPPELFRANLRRAERKFDVLEQLGVDTMLVSLVGVAGRGRRRRARRRAAARAGRPRRPARPAHRLRGTGVGSVRQHLRARLADRPARRPSRARTLPRQLPRAVPRRRPGRDQGRARAPRCSTCSWPTRPG